MYNSLKKWANVPVKLLHFIKYNDYAEPEYDNPIDAVCYPVYEVRVVIDREGNEVVSSVTLYIDAVTNSISDTDAVMFEDRTYQIKGLSSYFAKGVRDIWVVHL